MFGDSTHRTTEMATKEAFAGMAAAAARRTPALFGPLVRGSFTEHWSSATPAL